MHTCTDLFDYCTCFSHIGQSVVISIMSLNEPYAIKLDNGSSACKNRLP